MILADVLAATLDLRVAVVASDGGPWPGATVTVACDADGFPPRSVEHGGTIVLYRDCR